MDFNFFSKKVKNYFKTCSIQEQNCKKKLCVGNFTMCALKNKPNKSLV